MQEWSNVAGAVKVPFRVVARSGGRVDCIDDRNKKMPNVLLELIPGNARCNDLELVLRFESSGHDWRQSDPEDWPYDDDGEDVRQPKSATVSWGTGSIALPSHISN